MKRQVVLWMVVVVLGLLAITCKKDDGATASQQGPQLTASPPSANVTVGTSQDVSISGGTPPYVILTAPSAIATAALFNPDSLVATLRISGVSVASAATSVTLRDNTPTTPKTAVVPVLVH